MNDDDRIADNRPADQCEVAEEIEDLVAYEFVAEAKRSVDDFFLIHDDAVLD